NCVYITFTAATVISTLSLHDALPICRLGRIGSAGQNRVDLALVTGDGGRRGPIIRHAQRRRQKKQQQILHAGFPKRAIDSLRHEDRKSTRLNSSHVKISYAVFCLKKK